MADTEAAVAAAQAQAQAIAERLVQESSHHFPVSSGADHAERDEDFSNKRKYDSEGGSDGDGPLRKRSSFNGPDDGGVSGNGYDSVSYLQDDQVPGLDPALPGQVTEEIDCPSGKVGKLIGRGGITIKDLVQKTGAKIQVDHKISGELKPVQISGSRDAVDKALKMIHEVLESDTPSSVPGDVFKYVDCPQGIVGRVIGRGGETIRALQQASGAHIVVDQNFPDGVPRKVNVSGVPDAVDRAVRMVTELINGEPGSAQAVIQKYGVGITRTVECPKTMVGRVIGKGGETIKNLQKSTGASIQIDQQTNPCKVTISGPPMAVDSAVRMINDIIEGGNPMGGGHMPPNQFSGPRGPQGGFPPQFTPSYPPAGNPYGGPYGAFPNPGGAPAPYGYYGAPSYPPAYPPAPAPGYGGYPGYSGGSGDPYSAGYGASGYSGASGGSSQPAGGSVSSVWQELHDNEGRPYYYNTQTGVSQWEKPQEMQ